MSCPDEGTGRTQRAGGPCAAPGSHQACQSGPRTAGSDRTNERHPGCPNDDCSRRSCWAAPADAVPTARAAALSRLWPHPESQPSLTQQLAQANGDWHRHPAGSPAWGHPKGREGGQEAWLWPPSPRAGTYPRTCPLSRSPGAQVQVTESPAGVCPTRAFASCRRPSPQGLCWRQPGVEDAPLLGPPLAVSLTLSHLRDLNEADHRGPEASCWLCGPRLLPTVQALHDASSGLLCPRSSGAGTVPPTAKELPCGRAGGREGTLRLGAPIPGDRGRAPFAELQKQARARRTSQGRARGSVQEGRALSHAAGAPATQAPTYAALTEPRGAGQ